MVFLLTIFLPSKQKCSTLLRQLLLGVRRAAANDMCGKEQWKKIEIRTWYCLSGMAKCPAFSSEPLRCVA